MPIFHKAPISHTNKLCTKGKKGKAHFLGEIKTQVKQPRNTRSMDDWDKDMLLKMSFYTIIFIFVL